MTDTLGTLKSRMQKAIAERKDAKQFSPEWFTAKAEVETLSQEINEIELINRLKANPVPDDFIFEEDGWDD